jgi:two-component system response regulator NreC
VNPHPDMLTRRERQVLRLIALGHTNREVGALLHISVRTAEFHRASIQRKLGLTARAELVRFAFAHEVLDA